MPGSVGTYSPASAPHFTDGKWPPRGKSHPAGVTGEEPNPGHRVPHLLPRGCQLLGVCPVLQFLGAAVWAHRVSSYRQRARYAISPSPVSSWANTERKESTFPRWGREEGLGAGGTPVAWGVTLLRCGSERNTQYRKVLLGKLTKPFLFLESEAPKNLLGWWRKEIFS